MKKEIICFVLLPPLLSSLICADELRFGIMGEMAFMPYKGIKRDISFYPFIHYDGPHFYIEGDEAGIYFLKRDEQQLSVGASYHWQSFNSQDSSDWRMTMLNKRKSSVMVNLDYTFITPYGGLSTELNMDLLRRNKGGSFDVGYVAMVDAGNFTMVPNIGAIWYSSRYNNYYYGISEEEAKRSGLSHYRSQSGTNPYAALNLVYKVQPQWEVLMTGRYEYLSSKVKNSPMVNKRESTLIKLGMLYQF